MRAVLVLMLCLFVSCGGPESTDRSTGYDEPRRGGTAVLGSITDVDSWNEYLSQQSFAINLLRRIYLRLAQYPAGGAREPGAYTPLLAESWSVSEDGLALTFTLREAVWSDGEPITARDVRFSWLAQTSEHVPWVGAGGKERITDVEVIDARNATFHFDRVYPYQLADAVDGGILPEHVFGRVPFEQWATHDWSTASVGSGPFLLERHRPAQETVLVRNPRYFDPDYPRLDRVVVRYVPDIGNLLTQLLSGDIDYLEGVSPRDARRLSSDPDIGIIPFERPGYDYIGWNGARPPFDDPELRRALTLAIDRKALVEDLLYGYGRVSTGPLPFAWEGAPVEIEPWPYDPDGSRRILAAKGYTAGQDLEIEMLTNSGNRTREDMLVKIQEQLSRVGVRVAARPLEMRTMRQRVATGDYDAYLGGWVFAGKLEIKTFFESAAVPPRGFNVVSYRSAVADEMFERLDAAADWHTMEAVLHEVAHTIHDDQPYTFLYETKRIAAHGPRLAGVEIDVPSDPLARLERFHLR